MTHPIEFRKKVIEYMEAGNTYAATSKKFGITPGCIWSWQQRVDLEPRVYGPRPGKIDKEELRRHVHDHPTATQKERADYFGVTKAAISYHLRREKNWEKLGIYEPYRLYNLDKKLQGEDV